MPAKVGISTIGGKPIPWSCVWWASGGNVGRMTIEFVRNGETLGSFAEEVVPSFVESGAIQQSDHFWHDGMADWQLVSTRWPLVEPSPPPLPNAALAVPPENADHIPYCDHCKCYVSPNVVSRQGRGGGVVVDGGEFSAFAHRAAGELIKICPHCGERVFNKRDREKLHAEVDGTLAGGYALLIIFGLCGLVLIAMLLWVAVDNHSQP